MGDLTLTTEIFGNVCVFTAGGPLDVYTNSRFREYLLALIGSGEHLIAVDVNRCDYLDSTGLGVLLGGLKRVRQLGAARPERLQGHRAGQGIPHSRDEGRGRGRAY